MLAAKSSTLLINAAHIYFSVLSWPWLPCHRHRSSGWILYLLLIIMESFSGPLDRSKLPASTNTVLLHKTLKQNRSVALVKRWTNRMLFPKQRACQWSLCQSIFVIVTRITFCQICEHTRPRWKRCTVSLTLLLHLIADLTLCRLPFDYWKMNWQSKPA